MGNNPSRNIPQRSSEVLRLQNHFHLDLICPPRISSTSGKESALCADVRHYLELGIADIPVLNTANNLFER